MSDPIARIPALYAATRAYLVPYGKLIALVGVVIKVPEMQADGAISSWLSRWVDVIQDQRGHRVRVDAWAFRNPTARELAQELEVLRDLTKRIARLVTEGEYLITTYHARRVPVPPRRSLAS
jgi:hypothetical protein